MISTFDQDYPAILQKKLIKKEIKRKEVEELSKAASVMSMRTHNLMVSALEDLQSGKKGLLVAFRLWKIAVGMNDAPAPPAPSADQEHENALIDAEESSNDKEMESLYARFVPNIMPRATL